VICFKRLVYQRDGTRPPSKLAPVIFSYRGLPHFLAIVSSLFVSVLPSAFMTVPPFNPDDQTVTIDGITITKQWRDIDKEKEQMGYLIYPFILVGIIVAFFITFLVAEQLGNRAVIYAITIAYSKRIDKSESNEYLVNSTK
jgi:hypothetical protein